MVSDEATHLLTIICGDDMPVDRNACCRGAHTGPRSDLFGIKIFLGGGDEFRAVEVKTI